MRPLCYSGKERGKNPSFNADGASVHIRSYVPPFHRADVVCFLFFQTRFRNYRSFRKRRGQGSGQRAGDTGIGARRGEALRMPTGTPFGREGHNHPPTIPNKLQHHALSSQDDGVATRSSACLPQCLPICLLLLLAEERIATCRTFKPVLSGLSPWTLAVAKMFRAGRH